MAPSTAAKSETRAVERRRALQGASGPKALVRNAKVFGIACFACLGGFLYGYNQGVLSGVLTMHSFQNRMGTYTSNQSLEGWLTAILPLGASVGPVYSGFIAEIISRKYAILVSTGVFIVGVVVQTTAIVGGPGSVLAGRFITGMGIGGLSMIIPMYNAECAPPEIRGALVGFQQFAITAGIMIAFWIDYGANYIGGTGSGQSDAAWLIPFCFQLLPALLLAGGMIFMPFTPRWLVHHGREAQARHVLANLRNLSEDHPLIELEFLEIKAQSLFEKRSTAEKFPHLADGSASSTIKLQFVAIASIFRTKPMLRRVTLAVMTMLFSQWTGINAIIYYAPTIFKNLGLSSNTTSLLATGVAGIAGWLATMPSVLYVDKVGRKPILISGAIGMATCHVIVAILTAIYQDSWSYHAGAGWAAVATIWLFVILFGYSFGPCAWIVVAEIWPISQRPYGISIGTSTNFFNNFVVGQVAPDMLQSLDYGTYLFLGLVTYIGAAFIYFFIPETKGLSLEEMDILFGSVGMAASDTERMDQINRELGLVETVGDEQIERVDVVVVGKVEKSG